MARRSRGAHARRAAKAGTQRPLWRELPLLLVVAGLLALLARSFVFQAFRIPSGSMENTLQIGDRVLVNKVVYDFRGIDRGDVVVFDGEGSWDPSGPAPSADPVIRTYHDMLRGLGLETEGTDYIKRVIGVPGDRVACCNADGQITVNGTALSENQYVYPGNSPSDIRFSVTVPPGHIWVMGDHRGDSEDSRYHPSAPGGGSVPESEVVGRAFLIIWPPSRLQPLGTPQTFTQRTLNAADRAVGGAAPAVPLVTGAAAALPVGWLRRRQTRRQTRWQIRRRIRRQVPRQVWRRRARAGLAHGRRSGAGAPSQARWLRERGMDIEPGIGNGTADESSHGVADAAV
jgi:signal peptidase I